MNPRGTMLGSLCATSLKIFDLTNHVSSTVFRCCYAGPLCCILFRYYFEIQIQLDASVVFPFRPKSFALATNNDLSQTLAGSLISKLDQTYFFAIQLQSRIAVFVRYPD